MIKIKFKICKCYFLRVNEEINKEKDKKSNNPQRFLPQALQLTSEIACTDYFLNKIRQIQFVKCNKFSVKKLRCFNLPDN